MSPRLSLTERDEDLLRTLSLFVRISSVAQIAACWWSECAAPDLAALSRLRMLKAQDLVHLVRATAIELPQLSSPLTGWRPGQFVPELGTVAWQLQQRWCAPARPTTVVVATCRAANRFGGRRRGRISRPFQVSHDLGVAEMYYTVRRTDPRLAGLWIDEDRLSPFRRGEKLPDAILASRPEAIPLLVLEFGGAYSKQRLEDFHDDCEDRGLPYQIW